MVVCLGVMMAFINITGTISALGPIQDDLRISPSTLVWLTSSYSLAVVSLVMSAGTLGDLIDGAWCSCPVPSSSPSAACWRFSPTAPAPSSRPRRSWAWVGRPFCRPV